MQDGSFFVFDNGIVQGVPYPVYAGMGRGYGLMGWFSHRELKKINMQLAEISKQIATLSLAIKVATTPVPPPTKFF